MATALDLQILPTHAPLRPSVDLVGASYRSDTYPQSKSREDREHDLFRYGLFLGLKLLQPQARLAPTRDIDEMWHLHMLSPVAYHRDCMAWFGRLLDHNGGFGKRPEEVPLLRAVFARTAELYQSAYGLAYRDDGVWFGEDATSCWHDCQDRCWHACSEAR